MSLLFGGEEDEMEVEFVVESKPFCVGFMEDVNNGGDPLEILPDYDDGGGGGEGVSMEYYTEEVTEPYPEQPAPPPRTVSSVVPRGYQNLSLEEFNREMEQSVSDIVMESIALFQRDPREYHPFYLRVWKYIWIGQQLGYVVNEETVWRKYDQFAREQYELSKWATVPFSGERSAYATYILTGEVVIEGKVVTQLRDEKDWQRTFRELEQKVKRLRKESKADIREDLKQRLEFFKECNKITFPADCVKMNNLWSKFLGKERLTSGVKRIKTECDIKSDSLSTLEPSVSPPPPQTISKVLKTAGKRKSVVPPKIKEETPSLPLPLQYSSSSPQMPSTSKMIKKRKLSSKLSGKQNLLKVQQKFKTKTSARSNLTGISKLIKKRIFPATKSSKQKRGPMAAKLEKILCKKLSLPKTTVVKPTRPHQKMTQKSVESDVKPKFTKIQSISGESKLKPKEKSKGGKISKKELTQAEAPQPEPGPSEVPEEIPCDPQSAICDECGLTLSSVRGLDYHKRVMHDPNRRIFRCPAALCRTPELKSARALWIHYYRTHMASEELPPEIQKFLPQRGNQPKDMDLQTNTIVPGGLTCEHCGKAFPTITNLRRHIYIIHGEGTRKENRVQCPYCSKEFKEKVVMMAHCRRFHEMTEEIRCNQCNRGFGSGGRLWKHKLDVHGILPGEEAAAAGVEFLTCEFCGEQLLKGRQIKNHVEKQHPDNFSEWWEQEQARRKQFNIERKREERRRLAEEGTGPDWLMRQEVCRKAVKNSKYCEKCKRVVRGSLQRHLETVHKIVGGNEATDGGDDVRWKCIKEGCRSTFEEKRNLVSHLMEVHYDLEERIVSQKIIKFVGKVGIYKKYMCTLCGSHLFDRAEVRVHIISSHPDIYASLRSGESLPTPEQTCGYCSAKFPSDQEVRSHIDNVHPDLCWKCPECFKVMLNPDELGEHFMEDHSNELGEEQERVRLQLSQKKGTYMTLSRRVENGMEMTEEERLERNKSRRGIYAKYQKLRGNCHVCGKSVSFCRLSDHLKRHGVIENGNLWLCPVCGKNAFSKRETWLAHMEISHTGMVNMEEMVEVALKCNTTMDLKEIIAQAKVSKKGRKNDSSSSEEEEDAWDSDGSYEYLPKKRKKPAHARKKVKKASTSSCKKKPPPKVNMEKVPKKRGRPPKAKSNDSKSSAVTTKPRSIRLLKKGHLENNIEKDKRLVIRVIRLREDEV